MKNPINIEKTLESLKNQKKLLGAFLLIICIMSISWIFSPESKEESSIQKNAVVENKKIDFNVELDTIESPLTSIFSNNKKEVVSKEPTNPFAKKEEDEILSSVNKLEKLGSVESSDPYKTDDMWKLDTEESQILGLSGTDSSNSGDAENSNDDEDDEFDESPIVFYTAPKVVEKTSRIKKIIKAKIAGVQTVTSKRPVAAIRLLEDMEIANITIPRNTNLEAIASFDESRVYLNIKHINYNQKIIDTDIVIVNNSGYEGIVVSGGTGARIDKSASNEVSDDVSNNQKTRNIPGSRSIIKAIFTKTAKAKLKGDYVLLKNNTK